jgi:hypothetical protein
MSLRYLSAKCAASSLNLTKADLRRVPLDVHDDLRLHLSKEKQIELLDGEFKEWWPNGPLAAHSDYKDGEYWSWYESGQLREHWWFEDGIMMMDRL